MFLPKCGAPSEIVINQYVLEQVVTHVHSVYGPDDIVRVRSR